VKKDAVRKMVGFQGKATEKENYEMKMGGRAPKPRRASSIRKGFSPAWT